MWNQNGSTYEVTLTLGTPDNIPEDDNGPNSGGDYFILISTSSNPIPGSTFKVQIPVDGVTLGSTALPSSASPANPNIIKIGMGGMMGSPVVISEIQTVGGGSNPASDEFIELYNRTPEDMDLSTWSIQYHDGASGNLSTSVPAKKSNLSGIIPSNGYFLIVNTNGYDDTKSANNSYPDSTISLSATGGTVFLVNTQSALTSPVASSIQDKVAWGTGTLYGEGAPIPAPPANGSLERKAFPESTTTSMITGIDVSMGNSFDSDDNASDFITRTTSEPQNNTDNECPEMSGTNPVVINEVYYKNSSTDNQWIELFNNAGDPMDLSGWKLYSAGKTYVFPSLTNIEANGYLVIHWNYGNPANNTGTELFTGSTDMLPMPSLAGDVFLTDEGDGAKDYVEYGAGGQASEMIAGGAQWPEGDYVPGVLRGESIGRGNNGYDTNKSSDWQTFISPTMGSMNSGGDSFAPDPVTNVVLADNDTMNYGLNGEDLTVTWTPATAFDPTFDKYVIYLLAANVSLDTVIHTPFAQVYGGQNVSSFTASPAKTKDSSGNNLTDGSYKAYVMAVDWAQNKSVAVGSASANLTAETSEQSGDDVNPPMINSMPVCMAPEGADTVIMAGVFDDRGLDTVTPVQLKWRVLGQPTFNAVIGNEVDPGSGLNRHVISWDSGWSTSTQIEFYLMAKDEAGNFVIIETATVSENKISWWIVGVIFTACLILSVGIWRITRRKQAM